MNNIDELFENAIQEWKNNKGVGTALIPPPLNDKVMIYLLLAKMYASRPDCEVLIVTEDFNERLQLIDFITNQEDEENNKEFKELLNNKILRIYSSKLAKSAKVKVTLCILYNLTSIDNEAINLLRDAQFKLVIFNKLLSDYSQLEQLYKVCPLLSAFKQNEVEQIRLSTPVEEEWIGVDIDPASEDGVNYKKYCDYIQTSLNIFGNMEYIKQARLGNQILNISASAICMQIATENGWSDSLDMSIPYNRELDELYNPNSLRERATNTYEIIRNRSVLVSDCEIKLEKIFNIVSQNEGKKILIINKRGEFANKVTEYINTMSPSICCANYHDKVQDVPAVDVNGTALFVKSGKSKGERRMMGAQAQKSLNEQLFNLGKINVLSLSNAPDKKLSVDVDVVIITSPLCEDIHSYMYRLDNIVFGDKIKLYSIFCKNTIEQAKLFNKPTVENHIIVNKCEIEANGQNNFDFAIED